MPVEGRVAIITGSTKGLGREMALRFADAGCLVVINGQSEERAREVREEIEGKGGRAAVFLGDISQQAAARALVEFARERFGRVDILINNAGIVALKPFLEFDAETWQRFLDVHLSGAFYCSQAAAAEMVKAGWGRIINISTIAATMANFGFAAYAAAKGGLEALSRIMAVELAAYGVTVNTIAPGPIHNDQLISLYGEERLRERAQTIPLQRLGYAQEVANLALFVASEEACYLTGQLIALDGGASAAGCFAVEVLRRAKARG